MTGPDDRRSRSGTTSARPPGALDAIGHPAAHADLRRWSLPDLSEELVARLARGDTYDSDKDLDLITQLHALLEPSLDVHLNRFARRRLYDLVHPILDDLDAGALQGRTIVDLGCGSINPMVFGFLFLMLGARRAYSIDLDPIQDVPRAVRALATAASWLLIDPVAVIGSHRFDPASVFDHLHGFDLRLLDAGDPAGLSADRLIHKVESIYDLSLGDGEADLISTVSLLEHLDAIDDALASLCRVTRTGGIGHHVIDFIDHRWYGRQVPSPFEFFTIESSAPLVHGCNRVTCETWCARFEAHGFAVERVDACRTEPLSEEEHQRFAEPYRSVSREALETVCARIVVRRLA